MIGRSEPFPAPAHGAVPDDGPARAAYEELIARLRALGWEPAGETGDHGTRSTSSSARPTSNYSRVAAVMSRASSAGWSCSNGKPTRCSPSGSISST